MSNNNQLFNRIDAILEGIDRQEDDPKGGWWHTEDGARLGRIKLWELKEAIQEHLITMAGTACARAIPVPGATQIAGQVAPTSAQPAALAQPAEGPSSVALGRSGLTPEEIEASFRDWWKDHYGSAYSGAVPLAAVIEWTQFALPRSYRPTFQPIPASERLPGSEDCCPNPRNGQGQWCWGWVQPEPIIYSGCWRMMRWEWLFDEALAWAPWWAFPLPGATEMVGEEKE